MAAISRSNSSAGINLGTRFGRLGRSRESISGRGGASGQPHAVASWSITDNDDRRVIRVSYCRRYETDPEGVRAISAHGRYFGCKWF